jgi:hypothetical protein
MDSKNPSKGDSASGYPPNEKGRDPIKVIRSQPKAAMLRASS